VADLEGWHAQARRKLKAWGKTWEGEASATDEEGPARQLYPLKWRWDFRTPKRTIFDYYRCKLRISKFEVAILLLDIL
jgi:hypothetical protein